MVSDVGQACAESILRSDTPNRYVKGHACKEFFGASAKPRECETEAAFFQFLALTGRIGRRRGLLRLEGFRRKENED